MVHWSKMMSCHIKEMRSKEKKWSRVVDFFILVSMESDIGLVVLKGLI